MSQETSYISTLIDEGLPAFEVGYESWNANGDRPENPYEVGSEDHKKFWRGYSKAYEAYWESH